MLLAFEYSFVHRRILRMLCSQFACAIIGIEWRCCRRRHHHDSRCGFDSDTVTFTGTLYAVLWTLYHFIYLAHRKIWINFLSIFFFFSTSNILPSMCISSVHFQSNMMRYESNAYLTTTMKAKWLKINAHAQND